MFAHVYSAVPLIFIMSASPAFWAVICVHNKQVQDKESKLRAGLTFGSGLSIIQQRPEEGWPLVILSGIKRGLQPKPRLNCVDLQVLYWFIPLLSVHASPCLNVKQCDKGGFCISLLSKFVNFALGCMWSRPERSSSRNPRSPNCSGKSHPSCHSFWMRLWTAGFYGETCVAVFLLSGAFWSHQVRFSPPILPFCLDTMVSCVWWGVRGGNVKSSTFIIWNRATTGCLRVLKARWKCQNLKSKMSKKKTQKKTRQG